MRHRDHCLVNAIIYQTIDSVQDQVVERYSPLMDIVDRLFGRIDEWAIQRLIVSWRDEVWEATQRLIAASSDAVTQELYETLEQTATARAHSIAGDNGLTGLADLI